MAQRSSNLDRIRTVTAQRLKSRHRNVTNSSKHELQTLNK